MEDLIRRQEAIEKLCKRCQISNDGMCEEGDCIDLKLIRLVPSVEAIPVEWIEERIKVVNASAMRASSMGQHNLALLYYAESVSLNDLLKDWAEQRKEE